ncbi:MAG TPA: HD domain-containing protein [Humisphaera sp.]|nr:HD domain-containing protein [Humisphaera sp.]
MAEKIIRDPVHDVIAFRMERAGDALLFRLLGAAEVQRLRRVRQLGLASLAYPGADHSRYSHSLGVMETARKMIEQLRRAIPIDEADEIACLAASLLHDLGHGPFSHVFERLSGIEHEKLTQRIIRDPTSEVHQILAEHDPSLPTRVGEFLEGNNARPLFCDILASQLDADRLDYLLRDNLMTGSRYGDYDLSWLLHSLTIDDATGRLAVTWKGVSAIEAYLQSRYHMYRNVYFHKVVRAAEGMVKLALQRARRLAVQDRLPWPPRDHNVSRALLGQRLSIEDFVDLDDVSVMHCFKVWTKSDDQPLAALCDGLLHRRLFKTVDLSHLCESDALAINVKVQEAIRQAGGDPAYALFYDEPSDSAYETFVPEKCAENAEILIRNPAGRLIPFASLSPIPQALNRQLMFRRLHVAEQWKEVAERAL